MYKLSAALRLHEQDVKDVACCGASFVGSVSRDGKVVVWHKENDASWSATIASVGEKFINSVAIVPTDTPEEHILAFGGQDSMINMVGLESSLVKVESEPEFVLLGHESNVCSLDANGPEWLISTSWDKTAIVWHNKVQKYQLKGHTASVWDAKFVGEDLYLTASADQTVKLWSGSQCVKTYKVHNDVVRSLVVYNDTQFISASNDGTIKFVDIETGKITKTLQGHESFIYKIKLLDNDTLVSCGEDKSVRVWDIASGKLVQTIFLPTISVWSVAALSNGDIVTASSDSVVRVFSKDKDRIDEALNEELVKEVESQTITTQAAIDEKQLSDVSVLSKPGTKEGQTVMIKSTTGIIEAFQWANFQWTKIGEVMGSAGNTMVSGGKKVEYLGAKYDFVFDVDVKDGEPPLKLPFNLNDNPYAAAEKFLADNELPSSYLQQVVDFIMQNTQGVTIGESQPVSNPYYDKEYTTFETFDKKLIIKGVAAYNAKVDDISDKLAQSEIDELEKCLSNVTSTKNSSTIYEYAEKLIEKDAIVGYDLLRIVIKNIEFDDRVQQQLLKGLVILHKTKIENADVAKMVMILRCLCNLTNKFDGQYVSLDDLNKFKESVAHNTTVKDSVKEKLNVSIAALQKNLK